MRYIFSILFVLAGFESQAQTTKPLFNGKDLNGWYTFFNSKGKNNDPEKIFYRGG